MRTAGTVLLLTLVLAGIAAELAAYWPGVMIWDSIRQYGQALSGHYDDWHPPALQWLWRQFLPLAHGPAPMLLLQLTLFWGGLGLIAAWAWREGRVVTAIALLLSGFMPLTFALMGIIIKDSLMAGLLVCAMALRAWHKRAPRHWLAAMIVALVLLAATLRFNAFLAGAPLLASLLPERLTRGPIRKGLAMAIISLPLLMVLPLVTQALHAEKSDVSLSLVIYDLGGITEQSGINQFPPQPVADPVEVNHRCYTPVRWDYYAWWTDAPCPIGFDSLRKTFQARDEKPHLVWLRAIATHPLAWAEHRARHFNQSSAFLVTHFATRPVFAETDPNIWGFAVKRDRALALADRLAIEVVETPFGWPICWIALAFGLLIIAPGLPSRAIVSPLALSSFAYGGGYFVFGVASEMRYYLWTIVAALIAVIIAAGDIRGGADIGKFRRLSALLPILLVLLAAIGVRAGIVRPVW
jgi:hypothetical protein